MASRTRIHSHGFADDDSFVITQIQPAPLAIRLAQQVRGAVADFVRDPGGYLRDIFATDNRDRSRKQLLYGGFALGVVVYTALFTLVLIVGLKKILQVNTASPDKLVWLPSHSSVTDGLAGSGKLDVSKGGNGGGGGGQNNPAPVSKGVLPDTAPHPPLVRPKPSSIPLPSLPQPVTVVGPVTDTAPIVAPIGFPTGNPGDFAPGPGDGGGIGTGKGNGAGPGTGSGVGPGSGGNKGGGDAGLPTGSGSRAMTDYDWGQVRSRPGFVGISWIHRPVPFVTPEARANKVEGDVILRATFMADGTIEDIQVVNGVDYMTESALESLKHSKFHPATVNGVPINAHNVIVRVRVSYKEVIGARP